MNKRIKKLRQQSLDAVPVISLERAELLTEFYKSGMADSVSVPVARAVAFKYILENKSICIIDHELIVGERGPSPKATPTYPDICTHTQKDFEILHNREKVSFKVEKNSLAIQQDKIQPFWSGRSIRDKIFEAVEKDWIAAYKAGVFTEFMEQRAPGHTVMDDKIFRKGFIDFKKDIKKSIAKLDLMNNQYEFDKREELNAIKIAADALIKFATRYSKKAKSLAEKESNKKRKSELLEIARVCKKVPKHAPGTFHEALQYYWFVHLGVITELNTWDSFNPGRLDQHLYPFYKQGLADGSLTEATARELLQAFWIKFNNQPAPPKVGVTAQESNTYTDFCLINIGGLTELGENAVNELSFIILDVIEEMRLLQPSSMVQISKNNPDEFLLRALKIVKTGFGQPSIFNTDAIIQELTRQGKSIADARNGGASGCVEVGAFGKESYTLTGYFNIPKILEITLNNGYDPRTKKNIGLKTGDPVKFKSFEELLTAFRKQLNHFIDIKIRGNRIIEQLWATILPSPFMSLLIDDCVAKGVDYNAGGARYNSSYIQGVGMGSITDSLSAIKQIVYDEKEISMKEFLKTLKNNFNGYDELHNKLINGVPKYGNDDDRADDILRQVFEMYFDAIDGRHNTKSGEYRVNLLPTTCHVYFGGVIGALPDGRKAGVPLSEGISPVQGADRHGPTAVFKSAAKIDHLRTGGTLLNQKFTPQVLESDESLKKLGHLVRSYFKMKGHHIQFNVVTAETLRKAQKNPEKYRDLIVRVAGYSDYFVDLGADLQNEIIERSEQKI
ncbi:MAG: trans-4-hydroxy-L-proline dehydratase [Candidatus Neomarinimicrobiota bacterium]